MSEQTLFIVKPDGVQRKLIGEIISRFEKKGFTILKLKMFTFTKELATEFYSVHKDKPFYDELTTFMAQAISEVDERGSFEIGKPIVVKKLKDGKLKKISVQ